MKTSTTQQLTNAIAAGGAPRYVVKSSYTNASALTPSAPMSYRQAKAVARAVREGAGWAVVERA